MSEFRYDELSVDVWEKNYQAPGESSRQDTWERCAKSAAEIEDESVKESVQKKFYELFEDDKFIPGGRIMANLGVPGRSKTTLFNCYVHNPADIGLHDPDSIDGIYTLLKAQARTLQSEGGYGINASFIRPAGLYIAGIGSRSPGVLKFMELWDKSSEIITQGSTKILGEKKKGEKNKIRKGAQMLVLSCFHPDIEEFIIAKQTPHRLTKFNMSVGIIPGFMNAVKNDLDWDLVYPETTFEKYTSEWKGDIEDWTGKGYPVIVYKTLKARDLWDRITQATYNRAEPGILNLDLANKLNPTYYIENIATSNPCLVGDTVVKTSIGDFTIQHISENIDSFVGVTIPNLNTDSKTKDSDVIVSAQMTKTSAEVIKLVMDDDSEIILTPDHRVFTLNRGYVEAQTLTSDDEIVSL